MPYSHLSESFVNSSAIARGRTLWERIPEQATTDNALLFLDAELYIERVRVVEVLEELITAKQIPEVPAFLVSYGDSSDRAEDFICNHQYDAFLTQDVLPTILTTHREIDPQKIVLVGLSLSGLAATHVALRHPSWFQAVITQSASFWWEREQLRQKLPQATDEHPRFWISVGNEEIDDDVFHASAGLHQTVSQINACQGMHEAMQEFGYRTEYRVFSGGHDCDCWRDDLRLALLWAFAQTSADATNPDR